VHCLSFLDPAENSIQKSVSDFVCLDALAARGLSLWVFETCRATSGQTICVVVSMELAVFRIQYPQPALLEALPVFFSSQAVEPWTLLKKPRPLR